MIEELDEHVDSTAGRLAKAQRKMDRFVRENSAGSSPCLLLPQALTRATCCRLGIELVHLYPHDRPVDPALYHPVCLDVRRLPSIQVALSQRAGLAMALTLTASPLAAPYPSYSYPRSATYPFSAFASTVAASSHPA